MKAIGLNDSQRSKLEELCIAYFPEYNGMITIDRVAVLFNGKNPIHWFELSMFELPKRMFGYTKPYFFLKQFSYIMQLEKDWENFKPHPIDYLYEKYQEELKTDVQLNILKSQ